MARTETGGKSRRPGPAAVLWGSLALFAVLFALLTYQLGTGRPPPRPVLLRKVVKRRVITTIVPTPGRNSISTSAAAVSGETSPAYAPVTTSAS